MVRNRIDFTPLPPQSVPEDASDGTDIVDVDASGGIGPIRYSITGGNVNGAFDINQDTGSLTLAGSLDFETRDAYTLTVRAVSIETSIEASTTLQISVLDINEPHSFVTQCALMAVGCSFEIAENRPITTLGRVQASDPDLSTSVNGTLDYFISNINFPFAVNGFGDIRTTMPLDREAANFYSFSVVARDRCVGGCAFTRSADITVTVTDLNDNPPVFMLAPVSAEVSEDASLNTVIAQYIATDADSPENAQITYSLSPTNFPFTLNPSSGILTLTGAIDFETRQSYPVTVTASNPGTALSDSINTNIVILNVNDNAPMFLNTPYSDTVVENSPQGTEVFQVEAMDADLGIHGELQYFITGGNFNDSFNIGRQNGMITVLNNIDRESITNFDLVVIARDRGTPQRKTATTTIPITVIDVNDNRPIFQPSVYTLSLREDLPVGEDIEQVTASDTDEPGNPNSQIQYSIASGNNEGRFRINSGSGLVEIDSSLDFETTSSYNLVIEGRDAGSPVMSGSATLSITVINVNENPPTLTGNQEEDVSEAAPLGTTVAVFDALDPDQMAVTFSITGGNSEGRFMIGEASGEITLVQMLDYETTTRYVLNIQASDGQQSASATLTVNVLDENEFSPVFMGPTAFSVEEEVLGGTLVGTVLATDNDRDAVVTYSFLQQDSVTSLFNLDPSSGEIRTRGRLDREQLTQIFPPPNSVVGVQISARDNGSPSRFTNMEFSITLIDINDNSPIFTDTSYGNMIMENLPQGQEVFPASATDADIGNNGAVSYSYVLLDNAGGDNPFTIDQSTGLIMTTAPLDCEARSFYQFRITAEDMGTPQRRSSTVLGNLTVIDVNDNPPVFNMSVYRRTLPEDTFPTSEILTVMATDADKGLNGDVQYTIVSDFDFTISIETNEVTTFFTVGLETGILRNSNEFDFESASQINLTIFANDRGVPQMSSSTLVILNIENVDERNPLFRSSATSCDARVSESHPIGEEITQCLADDFDSIAAPGQIPIMYSLATPSEIFAVDPVTAVITSLVPLDREMSTALSVRVRATDLANGFSERRVIIRISDVNDNAPQFQNTPYSFSFSDSATRTVRDFLTASATDPDSGDNGTFSYSLGTIQKLNGNTQTRIEVIATDNGTPSLSSSTFVTVTFSSPCQLQEYSIDPLGGTLSASLLCSVSVSPASLTLVLGRSGNLECTAVGNMPISYQFLHNGSAVTAPMLVAGGSDVVPLSISDVGFTDAGQYACRATTSAGSLQTSGIEATILGKSVIQGGGGSTGGELYALEGIPPPPKLRL